MQTFILELNGVKRSAVFTVDGAVATLRYKAGTVVKGDDLKKLDAWKQTVFDALPPGVCVRLEKESDDPRKKT